MIEAEIAFRNGFKAAVKYFTDHLTDEQIALLQDAEWESYAAERDQQNRMRRL